MAHPRIIYEGDEAAAHRHLPVAQNLLHKVRAMATASRAGATGLSLSPDPDSFIYALKIGNTEVLHIFSAPQTSYEPPSFESVLLPDVLNGVTKTARLKKRVDANGHETSTLDSFKPNPETAAKYKRHGFGQWDRLAVRPNSAINTIQADWATQYNVVHPAAYSGRMGKLVQVLLGFGRVSKNRLVGTKQEQARAQTEGVQVAYDSRWHRCHILSTGADGKLWLVEISMNNGVLAMRLPLYPKQPSTEDASMKAIVAEFKGLPTGQTFPTGKLLEKAIAHGTVLRLASANDLGAFYKLQSFSTAMGWATNSKGDEAHNTGWHFGEDTIRRSCHYRLSIKIGATKTNRAPGEPLADGSATLQRVSEGPFFHPSRKFPPPIKFWEPLIDGLMSVDMRASEDVGNAVSQQSINLVPICDVTMYVCYVEDQLKLVKYFWDRTNITAKTKVTTNFEPCMYIGSWFREEVTPLPDFVSTFYTTDFDHRGQGSSQITRTDIVGTDMGRWSYNWGVDTFIPFTPQWGYLNRYRTYRMREVTTVTAGQYTQAAILVPRGMRDGYVYARMHSKGAESVTTGTNYDTLTDPNSYQLYQYFYDSYKPKDGCWNRFGYKVFKAGAPARDQCNELVDQGSWHNPCDAGEPKQGPVPPLHSQSIKSTEAVYTVEPHLVTGTERGTIALRRLSGDYQASYWASWIAHSPDLEQAGVVQRYDAIYSTIGAFNIAYYNQLNGEQKRLGDMIASEAEADYNFVGVL